MNKGKTKRVMFSQIGKLLCGAILAVASGRGGAGAAQAQDYPTRPISIVVPYPAGGVTDTVVRLLTERMRTVLGQPIVTENMGGASGTVGAAHVARATPDGYTLLLGNSEAFVLTPATMKLPYDPATAFAPIALLPSYPFILVSTNDVPAKTLKELIAWIKANPQKVLQGTVGSGTAQQLCGVSMQRMIGTKWQLIPYRGGPPAMQDMLAGQINFMCTATGSFLPLVRAGKIRAYALTAKARSEAAPDIPTVDEAGLPGLYVSVWNALWAPAGTPPEIVAKLNVAADAAMADSTFTSGSSRWGSTCRPPISARLRPWKRCARPTSPNGGR